MPLSLGDILAPGLMERKRSIEDRDRLLALRALLARAAQPETFEGVSPGEPTPEDIANYERAFGTSYPAGAGLPRAPIAQKIYEMTAAAAPKGEAAAAELLARLWALQKGGIGELLATQGRQAGAASAAEELALRRTLLEGGAPDLLLQEQAATGRGRAAEEGAYLGEMLEGGLDKSIEAWRRRAGAEYQFGLEHLGGIPGLYQKELGPEAPIGEILGQIEADKLKAREPAARAQMRMERVNKAHEFVIKVLKEQGAPMALQMVATANPKAIIKNPEIAKFFTSPGIPPEVKRLFDRAVMILEDFLGEGQNIRPQSWRDYQ